MDLDIFAITRVSGSVSTKQIMDTLAFLGLRAVHADQRRTRPAPYTPISAGSVPYNLANEELIV
jgi:hypothetical protein